jgi:hypothetical protein
MSERKSLFNALTVFAGIIFAVQGLFSHIVYLAILAWLGLIFLLVALHRELLEVYGKWSKYISPILFVLILIFYYWDPISSLEESKSQKEIRALQDSVVISRDSIRSLHFLLALAETSRVNARKALERGEKYFNVANAPSVGIVTMELIRTVGKKMSVKVIIENYGQSIAKQVRAMQETRMAPVSTPDEFLLGKSHEITMPDLHPKERKFIQLDYDWILTQDANDGINQKKYFVFVYGRITFQDSFGKKDSTLFCSRYNPDNHQFYDVRPYKFRYD